MNEKSQYIDRESWKLYLICVIGIFFIVGSMYTFGIIGENNKWFLVTK